MARFGSAHGHRHDGERLGARLGSRCRVHLAVGVLAVVGLSPLLGTSVASAATPAAAPSCEAAGSTGLTAAMVVTTNVSDISLNASGCDIGLYVPPGTSGITISGVTVSGANDHGIFVQDASDITISASTITGNGVGRTAGISDDKAVMMVGTSSSTITGNTVTGNVADGGIGIYDDGPVDVGAPKPGASSPANGDTISGNTVSDNYGGCAIVVSSASANIPAAGAANDVVSGNTLTGAPGRFGPHGPVVGGIIVAGRSLSNISVTGNSITGAAQPGVVVHANAPGSLVSGVHVTGNTMSGNDWLGTNGPPVPAAVVVAATPIPPPATPVITGTTITGNTITDEMYGIWLAGASGSITSPNAVTTGPGGRAVFVVPPAGSGYWEAAADGGVFGFGTAGFYGSMGGKPLDAPVVGLAPTLDQGGYWEAAKDGGVFNFGDAAFYGSMGGHTLNAPVVGIAATPVAPAPPGGTSSPAGKGYWLVASDGGVFGFGDAGFYGSMGGRTLNAPVVGIAPVGVTASA